MSAEFHALPDPDAVPTALYRIFGRDDSLLYVGISMKITDRIAQHAADKSWWGEVARIQVEHFADRHAALAAEADAIAEEDPVHNVVRSRRIDQAARAERRRELAAEREAELRDRNLYKATARCSNCRALMFEMPKGVLVHEVPCHRCECKTMRLGA